MRFGFLTFLVLLLLPALLSADRGTLILTANTSAIYPAATDKPPVENPSALFEEAVEKLRTENPDAMLAEVGNFLSLSYSFESAYTHPAVTFRTRAGFDALNLSARDAAIGTVGIIGLQMAPPDLRKNTISGLVTQQGPPFPVVTESKNGKLPTTFVGYSDPASAAALAGKLSDLKTADPAQLAEQVAAARASKRLVVGMGDALPTGLPQQALPDLYVALRQATPADGGSVAELPGGGWVVQAPGLGEVVAVSLERDAEGRLQRPSVKRVEYLKPAAREALLSFPVARIGYPIPNANDVVSGFFGEPASVRVDRVPLSPRLPESALDEISVYHVVLPGEGDLRLYRVFSSMPPWGHAEGTSGTGFPDVDMVVVLDDKHGLRRVLNRTKFPVAMAPTTLLEALNGLAGKDESTWQPDPQTTAGAEELFSWLTTDIRATMEIDRKLYGPGGLMTSEASPKKAAPTKSGGK